MSALDVIRDERGRPLAVRIGGILPEARLNALWTATVAEEKWFVEASTGGRDDYRRALVLYTPVDIASEVVERVRHLAPRAARALGFDLGEPSRVECQHTAHLDGGYYRAHSDDDGSEAGARALSYVYYYHRLPRPYRGGALGVYPSPDEAPLVIEPEVNELVLFPSALVHEVQDVGVPSRAFLDARFSVNGWLWR